MLNDILLVLDLVQEVILVCYELAGLCIKVYFGIFNPEAQNTSVLAECIL